MEKRVVKIPMPVDLIRRMDEALSTARGGLETREQFVREAVEGLLAEMNYPEAPPEPLAATPARAVSTPGSSGSPLLEGVLASVPSWEQEELRLSDLAGSALPSPPPGATLDDGIADCADEPMLGLHNRDYPSLWAAWRLARYTEEGPISLREFQSKVTRAAWFYATRLQALESGAGGLRLTALFPTNAMKQEAAEQGFQTFALGEIPRRLPSAGEITVRGPFFAWRMCQLIRQDGDLLIGLTKTGRQLLDGLTGLSLRLPHEEAAAELFLSHLCEHAPGERWGFEHILSLVREEPSREELVAAIGEEKSAWTHAFASSVAQGYVARAREWGLLEPRIRQGRYRLTEFGEKWQRELAGSSGAIDRDQEIRS